MRLQNASPSLNSELVLSYVGFNGEWEQANIDQVSLVTATNEQGPAQLMVVYRRSIGLNTRSVGNRARYRNVLDSRTCFIDWHVHRFLSTAARTFYPTVCMWRTKKNKSWHMLHCFLFGSYTSKQINWDIPEILHQLDTRSQSSPLGRRGRRVFHHDFQADWILNPGGKCSWQVLSYEAMDIFF